MLHRVADWCNKAVLCVICCVCHVTVSINDNDMGEHSLQKCLASPVFVLVVKLIHPLALRVQSVLKVS
jgi:hypothetical protein